MWSHGAQAAIARGRLAADLNSDPSHSSPRRGGGERGAQGVLLSLTVLLLKRVSWCLVRQVTDRRGPVQGYGAQASLVQSSLEAVIAACAARRESMLMEGVLLSPACLHSMLANHPGMMPFLVYIRSEAKHRERFAVRTLPVDQCMADGGFLMST